MFLCNVGFTSILERRQVGSDLNRTYLFLGIVDVSDLPLGTTLHSVIQTLKSSLVCEQTGRQVLVRENSEGFITGLER